MWEFRSQAVCITQSLERAQHDFPCSLSGGEKDSQLSRSAAARSHCQSQRKKVQYSLSIVYWSIRDIPYSAAARCLLLTWPNQILFFSIFNVFIIFCETLQGAAKSGGGSERRIQTILVNQFTIKDLEILKFPRTRARDTDKYERKSHINRAEIEIVARQTTKNIWRVKKSTMLFIHSGGGDEQ